MATYQSGCFTIHDYSKDYLDRHKRQAQQALEACGMAAETYAKVECPTSKEAYGGTLKNSISHAVKGYTMYVGTNVKYAIYVEMGTGIENVEGGTTKKRWFYISDRDGQWHVGKPQKARPFLKSSIADHIDVYKKIIKKYLGSETP